MRILVLDDDAEYSEQVAEALRRKEPADEVQALATADAARLAVHAASLPFDVFLIDQKLDQGHDGIDLLRELRAHSPDTDAIIFTGYNDFESGLRAYEAGAHQYLPKPIKVSELHWVLQLLRDARAVEQERLWLRTLTEIAEAAQRTLRWPDLADILTQGALRLGFERAQFWQLAPDDQTLIGVSQAGTGGLPDFVGRRMPVVQSPYSAQALASREPVFFHGCELEAGYLETWLEFEAACGEWASAAVGGTAARESSRWTMPSSRAR
jgi:DNA-binding NarL/FixJ family response regulator